MKLYYILETHDDLNLWDHCHINSLIREHFKKGKK